MMKIGFVRTSKLDQLKLAMEKQNYIKAISIASKFYDLGKQKDPIKKAQDALLVPDFYKQIGKDPQTQKVLG